MSENVTHDAGIFCYGCNRHLYKAPEHNVVRRGCFVRYCSDECLSKNLFWLPPWTLQDKIVTAIVQTPELYDTGGLPQDIQGLIKWAVNCKDISHCLVEGVCRCVAYDCYEHSTRSNP
jgi:hypothetical protein